MLTMWLPLVIGAALGAAVTAAVLLARHTRLAADAARLSAELQAAHARTDDERARVAAVEGQMRDRFDVLSREALRENRTEFLTGAASLLTPVRETLDRMQRTLADVDKAREGSFRAVAAQLTSLSSAEQELRAATEGLARALRSPNVRGKWGEVQLKRIVELAGMLDQCDFVEKPTLAGDNGARQTPDLVVNLPGGSHIVIDAKVPIDAYLDATAAKTDAERQDRLAAHARQVAQHVRALGAKEYWKQFDQTPEFVVMFLPLEPLLGAAFEHDGTLLDQAAGQRVILATPMTLLALLKAVAYGWQQQAVQENAEEIRTLGRQLYERLAIVAQHVGRLGESLEQAAASYNSFIASLERNLLPGARRFKELGVSTTKEMPIVEPIALDLHVVTRDELVGGDVDVDTEDEPAAQAPR